MASEQEHFDAARKFQAYYDEGFRQVGIRAPQPVLGQSVNNYRRETLRMAKRKFLPQNHDLYKVNYRGLRADALNVFEPQLLKAIRRPTARCVSASRCLVFSRNGTRATLGPIPISRSRSSLTTSPASITAKFIAKLAFAIA